MQICLCAVARQLSWASETAPLSNIFAWQANDRTTMKATLQERMASSAVPHSSNFRATFEPGRGENALGLARLSWPEQPAACLKHQQGFHWRPTCSHLTDGRLASRAIPGSRLWAPTAGRPAAPAASLQGAAACSRRGPTQHLAEGGQVAGSLPFTFGCLSCTGSDQVSHYNVFARWL